MLQGRGHRPDTPPPIVRHPPVEQQDLLYSIALCRTAETATGSSGTTDRSLQVFVFALFFIFGAITNLNEVLISLNYERALLVQSAFFTAYFVLSLPAGLLERKLG